MRVIHRATEEKALLRGHALEVVDLKFLPGQDVIASVANDGNVYVWRLTCVGTEIKCAARPFCTADQPHLLPRPEATHPRAPASAPPQERAGAAGDVGRAPPARRDGPCRVPAHT